LIDFQALVIDRFVRELRSEYEQTYSQLEPQVASVLEWAGRLVLENISNSDALYHNMEHTVMVSLVGQAILRGKHLCEGGVKPRDWMHYLMALLCHDIGYVKGVCRNDRAGAYATGTGDGTVEISDEWTDVSLTPYHVDRSKQFVRERFGGKLLVELDASLICDYIEMTRFPVPDDEFHKNTLGYHGLVRAADLIGQLGDPNYLRKLPGLYFEFQETGSLERSGYKSPGHMRRSFAPFYWNVVRPYINEAVRYLRVTHEGKEWLVHLHSHVFEIEHPMIDVITARSPS